MAPPGWRRSLTAALLTLLLVGGLVAAILWASSRPDRQDATPSASPSVGTSPSPSAEPPHSAEPTVEPSPAPASSPEPSVDVSPPPVLTCDGATLAAPGNPQLLHDLAQVAADYGVGFEAAWFDPEHGVVATGGLENQAAWSTSKVPLAMAVIQSGQGPEMAAHISAALRYSDNGAAQALWWAVGTDDSARAAAVTDVLRQTGDPTTTVPEHQMQPPYSIFGQTQWSAASQVGFAQQLPCLAGADQVIEDMANVSAGQSWGLGWQPGAVFKGGWGPNAGGYLVRQFGWYQDAAGSRVLVALAVQAGSFEAGVAALDAMAPLLGG